MVCTNKKQKTKNKKQKTKKTKKTRWLGNFLLGVSSENMEMVSLQQIEVCTSLVVVFVHIPLVVPA
jgi:hypothetical protein